MTYKQYSQYAYTGSSEDVKNRIANNSYDTAGAEVVYFPDKYDIFVNKENTTLGSYQVIETHIPAQIVGSTIWLDHRLALDSNGSPISAPTLVVTGGGVLDAGSLNIYDSSIEFSTLPTSEFSIQYTAQGDKVWDAHINSLQNAVMTIEQTIGLRINDPLQTGLLSLPIVTTFDPPSQAALDSITQNVLTNIVLLGHLNADIKIGGTEETFLTSYFDGGHTITLGNPVDGSRDTIVIDAETLTVKGDRGESSLIYSSNTGDTIGFTGASSFASQMTVGFSHGGLGSYQGTVPSGLSGYYSDAMLRVNGPIYFGDGMSGVGDITFNLSSGDQVDIIGGNLDTDNLTIQQSMTSFGTAAFKGHTQVDSPGYFETNQDMVLTNKGPTSPTKIDGLDPSYADAAINSNADLPGIIGTPVYEDPFENDWSNPYISGYKQHPILRQSMYPMLGGWAFTGTVNFDIASDYSHKNVILAEADLRAPSAGLGNVDDYCSYAPGLFSPGDTYIEIDNGGSDLFAYPIYFHEAFTGDVSTVNTATGLNLYVVADDNAFEGGIAGQPYRIFQPSNAPMGYLVSDFTSDPIAKFGVESSSYYGTSSQKTLDFKTYPSHAGPSAGASPWPIYKRVKDNTILTCSLKTALQRNIDHDAIIAGPGYAGITTPINGVAYIYASTNISLGTIDEEIKLIASPSPYGICAESTWGVGVNLNPGQWTPVGEVTASTSDGLTWTHLETVGYRANGLYDSCWVPMVRHMIDRSLAWTPVPVAPPEELGRCLPIIIPDDWLTYSGSLWDALWRDNTNDGRMNFFVEHNLGPVRSLADISIEVYVGYIKSDISVAPLSGGGEADWASFHQISATSASVWGGLSSPYGESHHASDGLNPTYEDRMGFVRQVPDAQIAFLDSRFARISIYSDNHIMVPKTTPEEAEYIRVVIQRTK